MTITPVVDAGETGNGEGEAKELFVDDVPRVLIVKVLFVVFVDTVGRTVVEVFNGVNFVVLVQPLVVLFIATF